MRKLLAVLISLVSLCASADMNYGLYKKISTEQDVKSYISGFGKGLLWASVSYESRTKKKVFCLPKNLVVDYNLVQNILDNQLQRTSFKDDDSIEMIITIGFQETFPCTNK